MSNPCVNCGKQRVDGKTWKGKSGTSVVTYTSTICPDPHCQKIVDQAITDRKAKSALLIQKKLDIKQAKEKQLSVN